MGLWGHAYPGEALMTPAGEGGSMVNGFIQRHRSAGIAAFVALLVLLSLSCVCLQVTGGLGPFPCTTPAFAIEELLLDESAFPEGWEAGEPWDPEVRISAEQIGVFFQRDECPSYSLSAHHEIYRFFEGAQSASDGFARETTVWFASDDAWGWGAWEESTSLRYQSSVADQYRLACRANEGSGRAMCRALGQYQQYIVIFDTEMNLDYPDCMSLSDLHQVLIAIDERMALYLRKDTQ
jgi:hypothetical protein